MSPIHMYRKDWLGTGGSTRGLNKESGEIPELDLPSTWEILQLCQCGLHFGYLVQDLTSFLLKKLTIFSEISSDLKLSQKNNFSAVFVLVPNAWYNGRHIVGSD